MDRKEYRRNSEIIASLLLPLKMHCNENTNKCIDETLGAWSKLEQIEQIVKQELSPLSLDEMSNAEIQIREIFEKE